LRQRATWIANPTKPSGAWLQCLGKKSALQNGQRKADNSGTLVILQSIGADLLRAHEMPAKGKAQQKGVEMVQPEARQQAPA